MQVVRRHDRHRLDPVRPRRLRPRHLAPVGVAPLRRDADLGRRGGGVRRIGRERPRHQRDPVVEPHREAVHRADEGVAPAADHPHPEPRPGRPVRGRIDHRILPVPALVPTIAARGGARKRGRLPGLCTPSRRATLRQNTRGEGPWPRHRVLGISFDHMHMGDLLRQVAEHPDAEIAGICDPDRARMQSAVEAFGIPEDRVFTDLDACLSVPGADLAIVCAATAAPRRDRRGDRPARHQRDGGEALRRQRRRRPPDDRRDGEDGQASSRSTGRSPGTLRTTPPSASSTEGAIGDLIEVHFYDGNRGPLFHLADKVEVSPEEVERQKPGSWWYKRAAGGGSLLDYLGYGTTLGTWFMDGEAPIEVTCSGRRDPRHRGRPALDHHRPLRPRPLEVRDPLGHPHRPLDAAAAAAAAASCSSAPTARSRATTTTPSSRCRPARIRHRSKCAPTRCLPAAAPPSSTSSAASTTAPRPTARSTRRSRSSASG